MKIIQPHVMIVNNFDPERILEFIEDSGRICWQSEPKGNSSSQFVKNIINRGHTSVIEHVSISFDVVTNRGVLAEMTRHRIASYSVESTRYVKYNEMCITPNYELNGYMLDLWKKHCKDVETTYGVMIKNGVKPQAARSILNNSLRVRMRMTFNLRSLMNMLYLRCDKSAHPDIKIICIPILLFLQERIPCLFEQIKYDEEFYNEHLSNGRWRKYIHVADERYKRSTSSFNNIILEEL